MTFVSLGLATSLAWLVVVDAVLSLLVAAAGRLVLARHAARAPATLAALRLAPAIAAAVVVGLWVAPAYWQLEPRHAAEPVGVTLAVLAMIAIAAVASGSSRAAAAIVGTMRTRRVWTRRSARRNEDRWPVPIYEDSDEHASVSLIGIVRPRLFVGRRVRAVLTHDELRAVVAHEHAHRSSLDNLTRLMFAASRDILGCTRVGRRLEQSWAAAAEDSADSRALAGDRDVALHLASALVKVARLLPGEGDGNAPQLCSTFHDATEQGLLPRRVRRLLAPDPPAPASSAPTVVVSLAAILSAIVAAPAVRPFVHEATELLVRLLP